MTGNKEKRCLILTVTCSIYAVYILITKCKYKIGYKSSENKTIHL